MSMKHTDSFVFIQVRLGCKIRYCFCQVFTFAAM